MPDFHEWFKARRDSSSAEMANNDTVLGYDTSSDEIIEIPWVAIATAAGGIDQEVLGGAGAVLESDTSTSDMSFVVDEDDMVSDSATKLPTQQSVKAYVDAQPNVRFRDVAEEVPTGAIAGDLWYQTDAARLMVYHGGSWVEASLTTVEINDLETTGTPSGTTYLRGDGVWATPAGGGSSDAADINIADAGGLYTATNVEAALAEVKNVADSAAGGGIATTGTPVANDFARFTAGAIVEGRSYSEVRGDLGLDAGTETAPASPHLYQRWIDSGTGRAFYWDGTFWVEIAGTPPVFTPSDYDLSEFSGVVTVAQGGFGYSIDSVDGDPAGALEALGGAPSGHGHRVSWKEVTATTYTILPEDEGKVLLFNIAGGNACTVTLPSSTDQPSFQSGMVIGLMAYSAGTITITPTAGTGSAPNVDGSTAAFTLVQHGMASLTRMPADNFWNFSGQVGA